MSWRSDVSAAYKPTADLCRALTDPEWLLEISLSRWNGVILAAREARLLGALWQRVQQAGIEQELPSRVSRHLRGGALVAARNAEALSWELEQLDKGMLARLEPPVALKGAAYLVAGLPNAQGRISVDIDLLFAPEEVEKAEELLFFAGWSGTHHNTYDQRYYREWMHELPPLEHRVRGTVLDLHHNILPETFRVRIDPARLLEYAQPLPGWRMRVLAPAHMVLHAVAHLFAETQWAGSLRDLYDIHCLLEHYSHTQGEGFWHELVGEAEQLRLGWMLEAALVCARAWLGTTVPNDVIASLTGYAPSWPHRGLQRALFREGVRAQADGAALRHYVAHGLLFLRGHWLKMPPLLLTRHLFYKAFLAERDADQVDNHVV